MCATQNRFPEPDHDHASCLREAVDQAEECCRSQGVKLTPLRRRVLEIVASSHVPVGAYDIIEAMAGERRVAPMTVYRALDFLQANGLAHRLASLNAYIVCAHPGREHGSQFFICSACAKVAEISDPRLAEVLGDCGATCGFKLDHSIVELRGVCRHCQPAGAE